MQESRSIVWVSYLNRLLRCARENLRPVSLHEYQEIRMHDLPDSNPTLEQRAHELSQQLRDRIGTFQYRDLTLLDGPPPDTSAEVPVSNPHHVSSGQPEEEPARRDSSVLVPPSVCHTKFLVPKLPSAIMGKK